MIQMSQNFAFLKVYDVRFVTLGSQAEQYFLNDPNTCLLKLRQFGELLAQFIAARVGLYEDHQESQVNLLRRLEFQGAISSDALRLFHELRRAGNDASHQLGGDHRTALSHLKYSRSLGIWFHRTHGNQRNFKPGPFIPPQEPVDTSVALRGCLKSLNGHARRLSISRMEAR
jgi:type I restriction enzyme R subunit